jgi:SAM-dependent methyltransferase
MRNLGPEAAQAHARRCANGFYDRFLGGDAVLDIGYRGTTADADAITPSAIGIDLDYPGYDGSRLPFADSSQDAVFASHVLEHIADHRNALADWYRVVRTHGFIIVCVPHHYIYERRPTLPSLWNPDHRRLYTPQSLLAEIAAALPANGYRIRHFVENDEGADPGLRPDQAPGPGSYEIEIVLEKIPVAAYTELLCRATRMERHMEALHREMIAALTACLSGELPFPVLDKLVGRFRTFPPWFFVVEAIHPTDSETRELIRLVSLLLPHIEVDDEWYVSMNADIATALAQGSLRSAAEHWRSQGYFENRVPSW